MAASDAAAQKQETTGQKVLAWVIGIAFALGVVWFIWHEAEGGRANLQTSTPPSPPRATVAQEPAIRQPPAGYTSARTLYQEFASNQIAAERRYKDRTISVWGVLSRVSRNIEGLPVCHLEGNVKIVCSKYSESRVSYLKPGQPVKASGKFDSFDFALRIAADTAPRPF